MKKEVSTKQNSNSLSKKKSLKDYSVEELEKMPVKEVGKLFTNALASGIAATGEAKGKP